MQGFASTFDYIIVGAGSAGCTVASQLSRSNRYRVLLVESGKRSISRRIRTPVLYPHMLSDPRYSHGDVTTPQAGLAGRRILLPSGKGLGGSSLLNAMIYVRPHPDDIARWFRGSSTPWNQNECERALESIERQYGLAPSEPMDESILHPSSRWLLERVNPQRTKDGIHPYLRTQRSSMRQSVWQTYSTLLRHANVSIARSCEAESILIDNEKACGVTLKSSRGEFSQVRANKGIIISCGALRSPHLLLRSGVGPTEALLANGIAPKIPSPQVGRNLHDHLVYPIVFEVPCSVLPNQFSRLDRAEWLRNRNGPLGSNIAELGAFLTKEDSSAFSFSKAENDGSPRPDVQWHVTSSHYLEYPFRTPRTQAMSIGVTWLHPTSRGTLEIDGRGVVSIDPKYQETTEDSRCLVDAVQWTRSWIQSKLGDVIGEELMPGKRRETTAQLAASIRRYATTIYHYGGTCAMGTDSTSVCDEQLRVRGCENLFVCDASSIPEPLSGNTQATVMMLGTLLGRWLSDDS